MAGAAIVLLTALSGHATACACDADGSEPMPDPSSTTNATVVLSMGGDIHDVANSTVGNVTSDAEGILSGLPQQIQQWYAEADRVKDEAIWTVGDKVMEVYGEAVHYWPKRTPAVEVAGFGGSQPVPGPPDPGVVAPRPDKVPSPPSEDDARDTLEEMIGERPGDVVDDASIMGDGPVATSEDATNDTVRSGSAGAFASSPIDPGPTAPGQGDDEPSERDLQPTTRAPELTTEVPPTVLFFMAAAGLSLVAVLTWILSKAGPLAGLFSRQTGRQVLNHPVRAGIHAAIAQNPGITSSALSKVTGCVPSVLRYHVGVLRREEQIRITTRGKIHHFHDATGPLSDQERARECLFWRRRGWLATAIVKHPGATQQDVARLAGLPASRVCAYTQELAGAGLVRSERAGRCRRYYPTPLLESMHSSGQVPRA